MMRFLISSWWLFITLTFAAQAQEIPVTLLADNVRYETETQSLIAGGSVQVFFGGSVLSAAEITYDARNNLLHVKGPINLTSPDGTIILADLAELSPDFADGIIQGARVLINRQFQIASAEARRSGNRYNTLYRAVGSSCQVCAGNPTPIWQIRANRIVHDTEQKQIYFEGARLDLFGVTIAYIPNLRMPDPSVGRASGFLVPELSNSDIYGAGLKVPYYLKLGDHADTTLTPFLTSSGAAILETEYRQNLRNGAFRIGGALSATDGLGGGFGRGYLDAEGNLALGAGFVAEFALNLASDDAFLRQFGYSENDRLTSTVSVSRYREHDFLDVEAVGFQSLRDDEDADAIPYVLPQASYRRSWADGPLDGRLGVDAHALNLVRPDGRDVIRIGGGFDWRRNWTYQTGLQLAALGSAHADVYQTRDDPFYPEDPAWRFAPLIGAELRWPLLKDTGRALHVIEPTAQILFSQEKLRSDIPNEDSLLPELDETNLFSTNRFPGQDKHETGLRANVGVTYTRYDPAGWNFGATIGQVFRLEATDQFSEGSGLSGPNSDIVGALSLDLVSGVSLIGRGLFDSGLEFKRSEIEVDVATDRYGFGGSYVFLAEDMSNLELGPIPERHEVSLDGNYLITDNWKVNGEWRYDISEKRNVETSGGISYGNECIRFDLSLSRRFTTSNNVPPSTDISFSVKLAGLGGSADDDWPEHRCNGMRMR